MNNVRVGDIGTTVTGKTPSTKYSEYFDGDIMFVTPVDLKQNYYIDRSERYITDAGLDSIKKNSISGKSVLVGCIGSDLGNIAMVNEKCATNQQINSITNFKSEYSPEYVYYWFTTKKAWLRSIAGNTTTPIINKTDFDNITIQFPNRAEQDKIVSMLSTIDEKISLNDKIVETSEKLMREIYDYWFVQFDFPDENGRPYKSSGGEMVYDETLKREIPKGWSVKKLGNICKVSLGGTPSRNINEYWKGGDIEWLSSGEIANFPIVESIEKITHKGLDNSAAKLLKAGSIMISITGNIRVSVLAINASANQSVVGIEESELVKNTYLYQYLSHLVPEYESKMTGAVQKHINKDIVAETPLILPPEEILESFERVANPILKSIILLAIENKKLSSLRDWLLPMLMNGQVKVND